jgi:conjugal transfer ATP-binding protein TraC
MLGGLFAAPEYSQIKENTSSYPASVANSIFENHSFSKWLPYMAYDNESGIYINNDGSFGFILEVVPRVMMGQKTAEFGMELMERIPEGMFVQIGLFGLKNIHGFIDGYVKTHSYRDDPLVLKAVESFADFYRSKTEENLSKSIKSKIKNHRAFISLRSDNREAVESFSVELKNLCESNQFYPQVATPEIIKPVVYELFNGRHDLSDIPAYDDSRDINRQLIERDTAVTITDDSVIADDRHWVFMSPSSIGTRANLSEFGFKMGDNMTQSMNISQFSDTFMVVSNFARLSKAELSAIKTKQAALRKQNFPEFFTIFWDKVKESQSIMEKIDSKESAYVFDMIIGCSGNTKPEAESHAETIKTFWAKGSQTSIKLNKVKYIPHLSMRGALPFGCSPDYLRATGAYSSGFKQFASELCHYLPLEADSKGNYPNALFTSRRGQIAGWDNFKTSYNKSGLVVATSGGGKSMLLNYLIFNKYAMGGRVFVIDIGGSYRNLCSLLGGEWIEIMPDAPISFNPFSEIKNKDELDVEFLSSFLYMIGSNKNEEISESQEKFIKSIVQDAIRALYDEQGNALEIKTIRDYLAARYPDDSRLIDFVAHLGPFCSGGPYEKFFSGKSQINMNNDIVVLELGAVEEQAEIRDAIIFMMIYHMSMTIYLGTDYRETQVILDEAHKFLGSNPMIEKFIAQGYRRFRKHNASCLLATQSFEDIYNVSNGGLSEAGQVIISNSAFKYFLKQEAVSVSAMMKSNLFNMGPHEEKMMRSIVNNKGEYSEFLMITPENEMIPYRLIVNRFLYYIFTSDPDDKIKIRKKREELDCDAATAIEAIIKEEQTRR